jgi:hypothetical protein
MLPPSAASQRAFTDGMTRFGNLNSLSEKCLEIDCWAVRSDLTEDVESGRFDEYGSSMADVIYYF